MATLHVRRFAAGTTDAHGNPVASYGEPVGWTVWGLAPGAHMEPGEPNRDLSEIVWTVYAPKSAEAPTAPDLVVIDGEDYAVNGEPQDWTRGPWSHPTAGVVVELRRAEG